MTKPRPKTGEPRKTKLPLKIDRLPQSAQDAIKLLYDRGRTWVEIEEQSARPYSKDWEKDGGGFIDWVTVDPEALDLFPGLKLPKSTLQRWFDLRVSQVRAQVLAESAEVRKWVAQFVDKDVAGSNAALMNAMRDQVFMLKRQVGPGDQGAFLEGLNKLSLAFMRLQRVDLQAKRVDVDLRRVKLLEDREAKARKLLEEIDGGEGKPAVALTREDLLEKVREIYGAV